MKNSSRLESKLDDCIAKKETKQSSPFALVSSNMLSSREDFSYGIGARPLGRFIDRIAVATSILLTFVEEGMLKRPKGRAPWLWLCRSAMQSSKLLSSREEFFIRQD